MSTENVTGNRSKLRLKPGVRERIRARATSTGNNTGGDTGDNAGSSGTSITGDGTNNTDNDSGNAGKRTDQQTANDGEHSIGDESKFEFPDISFDGGSNGATSRGNNNRRGARRDSTGDGKETEPDTENLFQLVTPGKVFAEDKKTSTRKKKSTTVDLVKPLRFACRFIFDIPVAIGWGEHWTLDDTESQELALSLRDVLEAFPSKTSAKFLKSLEKYIPLITFGMTLYGIAAPRMMATRMLMQQRKAEHLATENQGTEKTGVREFSM